MTIHFTATQLGFSDEDALVFGARGVDGDGGEHYLLLQRDQFNSDEDWGVHLEFDDQSNGDYDLIRSCHLAKSHLSVDLNAKGAKSRAITGIEVTFDLDDNSFHTFATHLREIFRGTQGMLQID